MLGAGALGASIIAMGRFGVSEARAEAGAGRYEEIYPALDRFAEQFMRDMNSPGMTLVLADRDAVQRVVTYGFGDLEGRQAPKQEELFQIGSISKSFVALALLQLVDEGKLDLNRPIVDYLPWLRVDSAFAPFTAHHMLTHTSGLPGYSEVLLSDPAERHLAAYAPGEHFHYNNMLYDALGSLAWTLDSRELPEILRKRVFEPLGMFEPRLRKVRLKRLFDATVGARVATRADAVVVVSELEREAVLAGGIAAERIEEALATVASFGRPLRLLVAEDNATNQLVLRSVLSKFGITPDVAGNGAAPLLPLSIELRNDADPSPIGDRQSVASVAYDLMRDIVLDDPSRPSPSSAEFRAYLLDLYAECLTAVRGLRPIGAERTVATKRNGNSSGGAK